MKSKNKEAEFNTEFDPITHIGRVNSVAWPSVTQLLSQFRLVDYSGVPYQRLEYKRRIGIVFVKAAYALDEGRLDEEAFEKQYPEVIPYLDGYRKFREIENFEAQHKEIRLFSKKWRFHGAPDEAGIVAGRLGNQLCIVEYKTTWEMQRSSTAQAAAYAMLMDECMGLKIKRRFGLLLKPTSNYELTEFKDPLDFQDFQACVYLHWRLRETYRTEKGVNSNGIIYQ